MTETIGKIEIDWDKELFDLSPFSLELGDIGEELEIEVTYIDDAVCRGRVRYNGPIWIHAPAMYEKYLIPEFVALDHNLRPGIGKQYKVIRGKFTWLLG